MGQDQSLELLESLPELKPDERFCFDCNPDVPCFNQCCVELTLPLTPYDVLRLRRHMGMPSDEFLSVFSTMRSFPDTGFPLPMLRMLDGPGEPCPFVGPAGCSVYEDRPGACRCYPLGRGTKIGEHGITERYFMVREEHCHGFDKGTTRTAKEWFADQDLQDYNAANDRYMRLMALVKATGKPLESKLVTMCVLCLYQLDKFRELISTMQIFKHVDISAERAASIMRDDLVGDAAALDFALDWMELIIFGQSAGLKRKQ